PSPSTYLFFNTPPTTKIYTLSLHDALPICIDMGTDGVVWTPLASGHIASFDRRKCKGPLNGPEAASGKLCPEGWTLYRMTGPQLDRKSTRLNSSHVSISYAVFCLKKKKKNE